MMIGPERFGLVELPLRSVNVDGSPLLELAGEEPCATGDHHEIESLVTASVEVPVTVECSAWGEKMPFHHVRSTLVYTGSLLTRTLSEGSEAFQINSISTEELGEIRQAFRVLDRDGNGFISKQELGMAMRSLGYMPSEVELAIIMQRLDMDGDGQVDFEEFVTILGPKLLSSDTREGFRGSTIDNIFWQFDMQQMSLDELKQILFHAFQDHLTMKDIENIIINEEESLNETGNCPEYEGVHPKKKNRQTCVRKSLICAFAMAFIISVMLIAANQMLRNGME
uniref:calcium-binding protein 8-like n=1 Tax=Oncorhynchus gorbuscha TaxID=8017 RepID=UPI001EAEA6B7|nr:calcium-binding protein 8-like [Oncorhynchus gorbuscha]